ncbi:SDR family oxidoreductase [Paractinoplanes brasiliensis]|uniref:Short-subunit dehydrogenase n=1 Tax=Paractinoplanes brasiliensis TaxID=52695 RepID=A0A4V3C8M7_9ACTN|nr:SDR family oxidoreductase [Actinoplanes brasiliensis]TDO42158.1 short-subunit dehydrogenase [Actinoplanes brasiliensis]GID31977.1 hypothetical protein Abr02nite_69600 [Actinoplanes brasiliensis]
MPKPVADQVVVIAGASSGIGRATALAFATHGARVVCAARGAQALDTLVAEIRTDGGTAIAVPTDVTDDSAVRDLAATAERAFGRVDTWVNVAAVGIWGRVESITGDEFEQVMRVNFLGHVHGAHAALPALRRAGGGVLIGIASAEGVRSVPLQAPYEAGKFALRAFYDAVRVELAQEGAPIAVTTVLPASVATPFFEHARSKLGAMVKPPPPVYAPEVVAKAIVQAARHPTREVPVGGAAYAFGLAQRLFPALTDAVFAIRRAGVGSQRTDRPDDAADNVDGPINEPGRVHGAHPGRVLRHSPFTTLIGRRRRPGEVALEAVRRWNAAGPAHPMRAATMARTGWASALLLAPEVLLRTAGRPVPAAATVVARVLGTRQILQAAVTTAAPTARVTLLSAALDALHASTGLALAAASPRWRRIALVDATIATGLAVAAWRAQHDQP